MQEQILDWLVRFSLNSIIWLRDLGSDVLPLLVTGFVINWVLRRWLSPHLFYFNTTGDPIKDAEIWKRAQTFSDVIKRTGTVFVWIIIFLLSLRALGLDMAPFFASFGIAGIAVGLGAQNLVRDLLGGIFILYENHYNLGDWVEIAEIKGRVEQINLRTTVLRDLRGAVHIIPNGQVSTVTNKTKQWSQVVLDMPISPDENIEQAMVVMQRTADALLEDENYRVALLAEPKVLGVQEINRHEILLRVLIKTKPDRQRLIRRVLHKRLKEAFDVEHIRIAKYDLEELGAKNDQVRK